jgi:hypothetical protein
MTEGKNNRQRLNYSNMNNKVNREEWITEAMGSISGMKRAMPPADLYEKVNGRLANSGSRHGVELSIRKWAVAAAVLLVLNVGSVLYCLKQEKQKSMAPAGNTLMMEVQLVSTYNY